jgi:hypothetical protein
VNCETVKKLNQDYLERRLAQLDRNEFLRHINECASCERELVNYRDVFTFLGAMKPVETPRGFQNAIISQLKSEGIVHQPKMRPAKRWAQGFLALPGVAKYPLAAAIVFAALYLPLKVAFSLAGGAAGKATVLFTDWLLSALSALGEASFLTQMWDTLEGYGRALSTVLGAVSTLVLSSTGGLWVAGVGAAVALSAILLITRLVRKRSSHNAPLCL